MTKSELIAQLAERAYMPRRRAEEAVTNVLDAIAEALADGGRVEVRGLGSFSLKEHRAYVGRNPKSGEEVHVAPKNSIHFKVGKELREAVRDLDPENVDSSAD